MGQSCGSLAWGGGDRVTEPQVRVTSAMEIDCAGPWWRKKRHLTLAFLAHVAGSTLAHKVLWLSRGHLRVTR